MTSADGSTSHGENSVDADGAEECALAGHVGPANEQDAGFPGDVYVVANALSCGKKRMSELFGDEARGPLYEFRKGIGGMFVTIGREGEECFEFGSCVEPIADGGSVGDAPGFGRVSDLDGVKKWDVEGSHDRVIERTYVFHNGAQVGNSSGCG
jgi:hypothetical protein